MRYRAWREYRDGHPSLVLLFGGDEYPSLTRAIEQAIPAPVRATTRPAALVRTRLDSSWCMARPGETYVVYLLGGDAVDLDLSGDAKVYTVSWLDAEAGTLRRQDRHRPCRTRGHAPAARAGPAVGGVAAAVWFVAPFDRRGRD